MRPRKHAVAPQDRKTIAYVRVSTQEQADEGTSLAAQEARIGAYAAAIGFDVSEVIRDAGESAKSLQRPGMAQILEGVRAGSIGRVVILKLDRLTRSTRDLADILDLFSKADVALVSVSEHIDSSFAAGRMMVNMLGVVAQWQREDIAERTSAQLALRRRQRTVYGSTPFGYQREDNKLIPEPREQAALEEAHRMDRDGASFREIAARLTELGVMPHRGKAWHASSVRAVLRSKMATETAA